MEFRTGVYIVPTNRWYIERTVWLIAGTVLLLITALATFLQPLFAIAIYVLAGASITVALTGFCVIGNLLKSIGFTPALGRSGPTPKNLYFMQTDSWYLERRIYLAVGINLIVATTLALMHSLWWLAFPAFVGVAMWVFAATGFCIMANSLYWTGAEPRLKPMPNESCVATGARELAPRA
jgi:hypothetical protein